MKNLLLLCLFSFATLNMLADDDWGKTGHRVIGEVATQYITPKTEKSISKLLNGQSLALISNFGDDIKSDSQYDHFGPWHYVNFPFGAKYENTPKSENGDLIAGIAYAIKILKDEKQSKEQKVFYLKMLVHFIGDLHQPLHVGMEEDRGGNRFQVQWFGKGTNLHTVWDSKMLDSFQMSYTELAANTDILSKEDLKMIQSGNPIAWMYESRALCEDIYKNTTAGEKLGYNYMYDYMNTSRKQLQKGGIRLAQLLNDIFG